MIFFCGEIWREVRGGIIAGVGHPISADIYQVLGNKRVRLGRIIEWEKEHQKTYPRLCCRVTKSLHTLKEWKWVKAETNDHLIPYRCTYKV